MKIYTFEEFKKIDQKKIKEGFIVTRIKTFEHGFRWLVDINKLFQKEEEVYLTDLETKLLKLLVTRNDEIVSYNEIKKVVWKGKNVSIYTMRNIVNKIRIKTYHEIIRNHSNKGYSLNS